MKNKLTKIIDYLNANFNQQSENYSIISGTKPQVIRYDEETAISFWACGAVVCIGSILYFVSEDDGYWFRNKESQSCFSIGWTSSFIKALEDLSKYVKDNGVPVRYSLGRDKNGNQVYGDICHYKLI